MAIPTPPPEQFFDHKLWQDLFTLSIGGVIGSLIGATLAFKLERSKDKAEQKAKDQVAGNLALFSLNRMWSVIHAFETAILRPPFINKSLQVPIWFSIGLSIPPDPVGGIELTDLAFLLDRDDGKLIGEVAAIVETFQQLVMHIRMRSELLRQVQRLWAEYNKTNPNFPYTDINLIHVIGGDQTIQLQTLTATIVRYSYSLLEKVPVLQGNLAQAMKRRFDAKKIILYRYPEVQSEINGNLNDWVSKFIETIESRPGSN